MKIRENAWHHRFYRWGHLNDFVYGQTNLCNYFWRVVLGICIMVFIGTVLAAAVSGLGIVFYKHFLPSCIVTVIIAATFGALCFKSNLNHKRRLAGYKKPEPGLLRSYLKAKKDKVCPIVTFVRAQEKV